MKFSHSISVQLDDIDEHDHVNNVTYLRWIQDVAVAHWQSAANAELQKQYTWFVVRHEIDYRNRAFRGEELKAETWIGKATRIKCVRFTEIRRADELLVEARSTWCLLDSESRRPARLTGELRALFNLQ